MISAAAHIELNLSALRHNVQRVHELAPASKLMAVIKANAYGHGLLRIAAYLTEQVDAFAVARIDEALRLRKAQLAKRILVLQGFSQFDELKVFQTYQLETVVHSEAQIALLERANLLSPLKVWLKIDTGMNRLGIRPAQFDALLARLQQCQSVAEDINFITHFANADDREDDKTAQQLQLFNETVQHYQGEKSCANSAAVVAWPESHQDWVRAGLMLYGVSPMLATSARQLDLLPLMTLYSRLIAIKAVYKGETVGYGSDWVADKDMCLGVVSIGYGDGYPRYAKSGTPVLIGGRRVPLVGRVSMDMLTVDISACTDVQLGDPVTLWGKGLPVEEVAVCAGTIPYVLLCGIMQRVGRVN